MLYHNGNLIKHNKLDLAELYWSENNEPIRVGGVKYTVKDGIVYDAKALLADVKKIVDEAKEKENATLKQPGLDWE